MATPLERARAYLDALEADRRAALALSEQKAEEAKLIKARQEGFRVAMQMLGGEISVGDARDARPSDGSSSDASSSDASSSDAKEPLRRRARRHIPQVILHELSFSGEPRTAAQIAKAIDYNREGTETALKRLEKAGQALRNEEGRWASGLSAVAAVKGHAGNGKLTASAALKESGDTQRSGRVRLSRGGT
jgi:DNA-binding transcriptional ArsR family regulator